MGNPRAVRKTRGGKGPLIQEELSGTLASGNDQKLVCMTDTQPNTHISEEVCGTLSVHTLKDPPVVAFKYHQGAAAGGLGDKVEQAPTLTADYHNPAVVENAVVRRLTPLECERLQGFPDNHTRIPWKGKPEDECPDSLRYKAIGNSMAVPVMRWLGERIQAVDSL